MQRAGTIEVRLCRAHFHGDPCDLDHLGRIVANDVNAQDLFV